MVKGIQFSSVALLALSLAGSASVQAADEACDAPNPFCATIIHTESRGAKWRHALHDIRTTVDDSIKVYPGVLEGCELTTFEKIKADPAFYVDRKVQFDVYFGKQGS